MPSFSVPYFEVSDRLMVRLFTVSLPAVSRNVPNPDDALLLWLKMKFDDELGVTVPVIVMNVLPANVWRVLLLTDNVPASICNPPPLGFPNVMFDEPEARIIPAGLLDVSLKTLNSLPFPVNVCALVPLHTSVNREESAVENVAPFWRVKLPARFTVENGLPAPLKLETASTARFPCTVVAPASKVFVPPVSVRFPYVAPTTMREPD